MIRSLAQTSLLFLILSVPLSGCRDDAIESGEELALSVAAYGKAKNIVNEAYDRYLPVPNNWKDARYARSLFLSSELALGGFTPYQVAVAPCDENFNLAKIGAPWHVAAAVQTRPGSNPKAPGGLMIFDPAFGPAPLEYTEWRNKLGLTEKNGIGNGRPYNSMMFPGTEYFIGLTEFDRDRGNKTRNINLFARGIAEDKDHCNVRLRFPASDITLRSYDVNFKISYLEDACRALVDIYDAKTLGFGRWNETRKRLAARFNQTARMLKGKGLILQWESDKFCCQRHLEIIGWPRATVSEKIPPSEEPELCFTK